MEFFCMNEVDKEMILFMIENCQDAEDLLKEVGYDFSTFLSNKRN